MEKVSVSVTKTAELVPDPLISKVWDFNSFGKLNNEYVEVDAVDEKTRLAELIQNALIEKVGIRPLYFWFHLFLFLHILF